MYVQHETGLFGHLSLHSDWFVMLIDNNNRTSFWKSLYVWTLNIHIWNVQFFIRKNVDLLIFGESAICHTFIWDAKIKVVTKIVENTWHNRASSEQFVFERWTDVPLEFIFTGILANLHFNFTSWKTKTWCSHFRNHQSSVFTRNVFNIIIRKLKKNVSQLMFHVKMKQMKQKKRKTTSINNVAQHTFEWNADTYFVRYLHTSHNLNDKRSRNINHWNWVRVHCALQYTGCSIELTTAAQIHLNGAGKKTW